MNPELESKIIGEDLCKLATILGDNMLVADSGKLNSAGFNCIKKSTGTVWHYEFENLQFNIPLMSKRFPSETESLELFFSIKIKGECISDSSLLKNPLTSLDCFDIEVTGKYKNNSDKYVDLIAAWHLDPHDGKETKYSHPIYHLTFGGNKMYNNINDYGQTLILPTPRFAYPPMDAVLGIDFILQNYFPFERIKTILKDPKYKEIVGKSKDRIWKPYFYSIYSHWDSKPTKIEGMYQPYHLFPLLGKS